MLPQSVIGFVHIICIVYMYVSVYGNLNAQVYFCVRFEIFRGSNGGDTWRVMSSKPHPHQQRPHLELLHPCSQPRKDPRGGVDSGAGPLAVLPQHGEADTGEVGQGSPAGKPGRTWGEINQNLIPPASILFSP